MKHLFSRKLFSSLIGVAALLGILIVVNVFSTRLYVRKDITEDKLYTLSDGTKKTLAGLPEIVTLKLFFSGSQPNVPPVLRNYAERVKDLLQEYKRYGSGNVDVEIYDPQPDSDEEEWAQKYGVMGSPVNPLDQDSMMYFGLVAEAADKQAAIPVLDPGREEFLEYDVTRLIHETTHPERKVVGIMSSLPVMGSELPPQFMMMQQPQQEQKRPWVLVEELKKTYDVRTVPTNEFPITGVDILVVIHPKEFPQDAQFAIDQYVLGGGKALVFVDPFCNVDASDTGMGFRMPGSSDLNTLFNAWGIDVPARKAVLDMDNGTTVAVGQGRAEKHPAWITVTRDLLDQNDVTCAQLNLMVIPVAGAIAPYGAVSNTIVPLIHTSANAGEVDSFNAQQPAAEIRKQFAPAHQPLTIAAKVSGVFNTAFPGGHPGGEGESNGYLKTAAAANTVLVVADVDLLADEFNFREINLFGMRAYQPFNNNMDFLMNAIDQLGGDENLISIRSRAKFQRPFTVVQGLERAAQERWLAKERELSEELQSVRMRLNELQTKKDTSQRFILSPEQQNEINNFQQRQLEIARDLKEVRKNLRKDIDALGLRLKFYNMALIPALVCLFGIGLALYRVYKVKQS